LEFKDDMDVLPDSAYIMPVKLGESGELNIPISDDQPAEVNPVDVDYSEELKDNMEKIDKEFNEDNDDNTED
jgi:hypothetical protein